MVIRSCDLIKESRMAGTEEIFVEFRFGCKLKAALHDKKAAY